jgi:hypothetical protein
MQSLKDFFTGYDSEKRIGLLIAGLFFASLIAYVGYNSSLTREEQVALIAGRVVEIHPPNNPTVVCFVLDNSGTRADSISCVKK